MNDRCVSLQNEMSSLKADNSRLQTLVTSNSMSPGGSPTSPPPESIEKRLSLGDPSSLGTTNSAYLIMGNHGNRLAGYYGDDHNGNHNSGPYHHHGNLATIPELK